MEAIMSSLLRREVDISNCTVSTCPVEYSVYGYLPWHGVTLSFIALFALASIAHVWRGIQWKSWTFMAALAIGCAGEVVGYVGRLRMHSDPFNRSAIGMQLVALTVAPAFVAGGIYLTLKHLIIVFGDKFSRLRPQWYTRIFVTADVISILLQAGGAGLEANGSNITLGNVIMMIGIVAQVVTLAIFGGLAVVYFIRVRKFRENLDPSTDAVRHSRRFMGLLVAIGVSYTTIMIRCIYRIAEMAGGWRNPIMQDQLALVVLDGIMCIIAVFVLTMFHPGFLFKQSYSVLEKRLATCLGGSSQEAEEMGSV